MSVAGQIYQLQEIDLEIAGEERRLGQVNGRLGKDAVVVVTRQKLDAAKDKLEEFRQRQRSLEWEIDDLASKIKKGDEELYSGRIKNPKELANLQHEVELLKAKRDGLETRDLQIMEQVESAEGSVTALSRELEETVAEWQREQEQLRNDKAALESSLSRLKEKRQTLAAEVDPRTMALYDRLRKGKEFAVARVEQGICRGCRISLPSSELQQARSGALVQCGSCGRILYLP
jgi:predicted  nucleic acid-binding Zn-ribbon protein